MTQLTVTTEQAPKLAAWMKAGGLAVWDSLDLSNVGQQWITEANAGRPHWAAASVPTTITDPTKVKVVQEVEVRRFHVAVRPSSNGLSLKVSDGGARKIRAAVDRLTRQGRAAWHVFDYATQEAVIMEGRPAGTLADY